MNAVWHTIYAVRTNPVVTHKAFFGAHAAKVTIIILVPIVAQVSVVPWLFE